MAKIQKLTFTSNGSQTAEISRPGNVVVEGNFGGGTVSLAMTGTTTPVRESTANDSYTSELHSSTFTLAGAVSPNITVTLETPE